MTDTLWITSGAKILGQEVLYDLTENLNPLKKQMFFGLKD